MLGEFNVGKSNITSNLRECEIECYNNFWLITLNNELTVPKTYIWNMFRNCLCLREEKQSNTFLNCWLSFATVNLRAIRCNECLALTSLTRVQHIADTGTVRIISIIKEHEELKNIEGMKSVKNILRKCWRTHFHSY